MIYLLDSNTLIEAKNRHYGMDFCPVFWDFIEKEATKTTLASIDMILEEINDYEDELSIWSSERKNLIFTISSDSIEIQNKFGEIAEYVNSHIIYKRSEKDRFLAKADPWLIAVASIMNATVVTHEVLVPPNSTKVKIPNIANVFNVNWINPYNMIRSLGGQFIS